MASRREGLRALKPKEPKPPNKTNAERCKEYRERLKALDPEAYDLFNLKKKAATRRYYNGLTDEQRMAKREKNRINQRKRRERLKMEGAGTAKKSAPVTVTVTPLVRSKTRLEAKKQEAKREKNKLSQQKRRASMTPQKKLWELKKRRERYWTAKAVPSPPSTTSKRRKISVAHLLNGVKSSLKQARSKLDLFKLDFAKKLLARKDHTSVRDMTSFYKRSPTVYFQIEQFFEKISIDFPGQKGSSKPKKVLTKSMVDLFKDFRKMYPQLKVSLTTFKRRRPNHILLSSSRKFLQCLCEKCTNIMLLMNVVNSELPAHHKVTNVDDLIQKTLCSVPKRICVERKCTKQDCGTKHFITSIQSVLSEKLHLIKKCSQWQRTDKSPKDLVQCEIRLEIIIKKIQTDLEDLAIHVKNALWQRGQYQFLKDNLPPGHAMCTLDFAENYLCKYQNEVQSAHWSYRQITIHPCVFFYKCPRGCQKVITDYKLFLSDDLKHDSIFAKCVIEKCIEYIQSKNISVLHLFSDGCCSQYKSKFTLHHLSQLQNKYPNTKLTRHFFGSNHGKSLCDSAGGTIKNAATRSVLSGQYIIQSASDMLKFCSEKLTLSDSLDCAHVQSLRSFEVINPENINRQIDIPVIKTLKGIRDIHSLQILKENIFKVRPLSCFCQVCLIGEIGDCPNVEFSLHWETVTLDCKTKKRKTTLKRNSCKPTDTDESEKEQTSNYLIVQLSSDDHSRALFFSSLLRNFCDCKTFDNLKCLVFAVSSSSDLDQFTLPLTEPRALKDVGSFDQYAQKFVPPYMSHLSAVRTTPDGNCIPRALSLHCFGNETHHIEIRCRIVIELVKNQYDYLCLDNSKLQFLSQHSPTFCSNLELTFQSEVVHICQPDTFNSFMGLWQLMSATNALKVAIFSVYPSQGPSDYSKIYNGQIKPRCNSIPYSIPLLWCATECHDQDMPAEYWTANHVVPLMGEEEPIVITVEEN